MSVVRRAAVGLALPCVFATAACTSSDVTPQRVVERRLDLSVEATLPETPVRQLAPIPVRLLWTPGSGFVPALDPLRVRLSFADRGGETRFYLDHELDPPLQDWLPGRAVEALLLAFAPTTAPAGAYQLHIGLYSPASDQVVFVLTDDPRVVGQVEIAPADRHGAPVYLRGWGSLEVDAGGSWSTWRWVRGQAEWQLEPDVAADSVTLWARSPAAAPGAPQTLTLWAGDSLLGTRRLVDRLDFVWSVPIGVLPRGQVFRLAVEPATSQRGGSPEQREINLRVFNLSMAGGPSR